MKQHAAYTKIISNKHKQFVFIGHVTLDPGIRGQLMGKTIPRPLLVDSDKPMQSQPQNNRPKEFLRRLGPLRLTGPKIP